MTDFSSMDRLMEFGLSMAVANQMIGVMNQTMSTMQTPGPRIPNSQPEYQQPYSTKVVNQAPGAMGVCPAAQAVQQAAARGAQQGVACAAPQAMNAAAQGAAMGAQQAMGMPPQPVSVDTPKYYAAVNGNMAGPLTEAQVKHLVINGDITDQTLVWRPGLAAWQYAAEVPDVYRIILLAQ